MICYKTKNSLSPENFGLLEGLSNLKFATNAKKNLN